MSELTTYNGVLFVPVMTIGFQFHQKEDYSLNAFQDFLINAIEKKASIMQIVHATNLTENVIRSEINQLVVQKLLLDADGTIELSDLSKHMLRVSKLINQLNAESKRVTINLITGELYPDTSKNVKEENGQVSKEVNGQLCLMPLISDLEINGFSIEDEEDATFFKSYMDSFAGMSDEDISDILTSLYIEYDTTHKIKGYRPLKIDKLPCLIGEKKRIERTFQNQEKEHSRIEAFSIPSPFIFIRPSDMPIEFAVKANKVIFTYKIVSHFIEKNKHLLSLLLLLHKMDAGLISQKGIRYIQKYKIHSCLVKKVFICTFDTVSGEYTLIDNRGKGSLEAPEENRSIENTKNKHDGYQKICLEIPPLYHYSNFNHASIISEITNNLNLSDDEGIEVILDNTHEEQYITSSSLNELQTSMIEGDYCHDVQASDSVSEYRNCQSNATKST